MVGLSILKHMHDLSDEDLCARWVENPYYHLFCGEEFFQHKLTFDRSSLTCWRQRMGEEKLVALIQESLAVATRTGAARPADFSKVIVDTTVQPKAVAFPTDAKLMHRARERLARLAKKTGVPLRQSYERVGKRALIAHQRYAHAKQFKRANRALRNVELGALNAGNCRGGEQKLHRSPRAPADHAQLGIAVNLRMKGRFDRRSAGRQRAGGNEAFLLNPQPLSARTAYEWGVVAAVVANGKAVARAPELAVWCAWSMRLGLKGNRSRRPNGCVSVQRPANMELLS